MNNETFCINAVVLSGRHGLRSQSNTLFNDKAGYGFMRTVYILGHPTNSTPALPLLERSWLPGAVIAAESTLGHHGGSAMKCRQSRSGGSSAPAASLVGKRDTPGCVFFFVFCVFTRTILHTKACGEYKIQFHGGCVR